MLSVHRPPLPVHAFAQSPCTTRRAPVVERGRSRDVSPAALARKASEERRLSARRAAVFAIRIASGVACASGSVSSPAPALAAPAEPVSSPSPSTLPTSPIASSEEPVASSSSCPPPPSASSATISYMADTLSTTASEPSSSSRVLDSHPFARPVISKPYTVTQAFVYESSVIYDDTPLPPRSVQDQMQEAYAADNMHLARVLFLKLQGIEVTSDDDPRIAQVRDEDFVFVPGGELILDDDSLAALNEQRKRREKEEQVRKWKMRERAWEAEANRVRATKALAHPRRKDATSPSGALRPRVRVNGRLQLSDPLLANPADSLCRVSASAFVSQLLAHVKCFPAFQRNDTSPPPSCSFSSINVCNPEPPLSISSSQRISAGTAPARVSFEEIIRNLEGPLFPETDSTDTRCWQTRSRSQDVLLQSLLQVVEWHDDDRKKAKNEGTGSVRTWACSQLSHPPLAMCVACSADTKSTISRANSWASSTSHTSVSTCVTSPPTSPDASKNLLAPLVADGIFQEPTVHSCRPYRKSNLTHVPLAKTPLLYSYGYDLEQGDTVTRRSSRERMNENAKTALLSRVKQSVSGLVDFASKMQQSYLRTIQFAVAQPFNVAPPIITDTSSCMQKSLTLKPLGYRASASDVQCFAPPPVSLPMRELNLPSEHNIPLGPIRTDCNAKSSSAPEPTLSHVFAPLAFVPPSPLRPRRPPVTPEWRLRPVANPCTLRLRALANHLGVNGIPWEGRAHTGSLGCGRERLMGVAFEGLGGSRLAFETK
ncbi:hypothetical protein M0805_000942 [Coniferiporia weirii]|nr:hypothetical protein M0805_000942 [Coniferiporia weirii]